MKKFLMPIFGGILLTSSTSLLTAQSANGANKTAENQYLKTNIVLKNKYKVNVLKNLTREEIEHVKLISQTWDCEKIDQILNQALQYDKGKLSLNDKKLDYNNLPPELMLRLNIALTNLNKAVTAGNIKVKVVDNLVILIYPQSNNLNNSNNDIIDFGRQKNQQNSLTASAYIWISSYGPSHWWRFWEWGAYVHFNHQSVENAKSFNTVAEVVNLTLIFRNIKEINNILSKMRLAIAAGDSAQAQTLLPEFSRILNSADLEILGTIFDIVAIFTSVVIFIMALSAAPGWGEICWVVVEFVSAAVLAVTSPMIAADYGNGVKWQWANYIIPWGFYAE